MDPNTNAIFTLCSDLCLDKNLKCLTPEQWSSLSKKLHEIKVEPKDILYFEHKDFTQKLGLADDYASRLENLIERNPSLIFAFEHYENIGIHITAMNEKTYPERLKQILKNISIPPFFYYAGNLNLLQKKLVGFVGTREPTEEDKQFTCNTVEKIAKRGYGVVSGGAKGVDSIAATKALEIGIPVVEFIEDSFMKKLRLWETNKAIRDGQLILLSSSQPNSHFNTIKLMSRNKYIYAQSEATIVIHSGDGKGGTWNGAIESLKHKWTKLFCWDNKDYEGNQKLISEGANPISETWNGDINVSSKHEQCHQYLFPFAETSESD